jgi:hypothetical protein
MPARLLAFALLTGCAWMQEPCDCGRVFEDDPWTEQPYAVGPSHPISVHCVCRCGDGPAVLEDPSARCELYEGDCTAEDGRAAAYTCE